MKRLLILYSIFIFLMLIWLFTLTNKQGLRNINKVSPLDKTHQRIISELPANQKKYFKLMAAFVVGDEKGLNKMKKNYKTLGLLHLFTPSGFHLQALLIFLSFIGFKKYKKKFLFISLSLFFIPGFEALKRIIVLKILESYQDKFKNWIPNNFYLFLIVFFVFFIFGDYFRNPLSFSLSFLFLGIIYAVNDNPKVGFVHYFFAFFSAQLLIQLFLPQEITMVHFLIGFFLGMLFNIFFPVMIICYLLFYLNAYFSKKLMTILLMPTKFFHETCLYFSSIQFSITNLQGALLLTIILILACRNFLPKQLSKIAIIISLTLFSSGIKREKKINKKELQATQDSLREASISRSKNL